jgi:hypothetical protein
MLGGGGVLQAENLTEEAAGRIRREILQWEDEFTARHGRKPTKNDLQVCQLSLLQVMLLCTNEMTRPVCGRCHLAEY